jgi:hypothetical protein
MDTQQIDQILRSLPATKNVYKGCHPCDSLPTIQNFPKAIVSNLQPETMRGNHWVGIYMTSQYKVLYFDSLGSKPNNCISNYFKINNFKRIIYNNCRFQSILGDTCGAYAIIFILYIGSGCSFDKFLNILRLQPSPDLFVSKLLENILKNKIL